MEQFFTASWDLLTNNILVRLISHSSHTLQNFPSKRQLEIWYLSAMTWWGLSLYSLACRYKHTCCLLVITNQTLKVNWRRWEFWGMLQTTENTVLMVHLVIQLSNWEELATVLTLKYQVIRKIGSKSLKVISSKWMQNLLTASVVIPINVVLGEWGLYKVWNMFHSWLLDYEFFLLNCETHLNVCVCVFKIVSFSN